MYNYNNRKIGKDLLVDVRKVFEDIWDENYCDDK